MCCKRSFAWVPAAALVASLAAWGCARSDLPDQSGFGPLESLAGSGSAVVRLYATPLPGLEPIALHPWFVVKSGGSSTFHRWEVWPEPGEPYGNVRKDLLEPTAGLGAGEVYVIGELVGPQAIPIVEFVETCSPLYPCRDMYMLFPGPNSASYVRWVLDCVGWHVAMPRGLIGCRPATGCR